MSFTVDDVRDLVRLLDERPEWRAEVRRQLLSDEFLALPAQIAEVRLRTERIEEQIAELRLDMERRSRSIEDQIAEQRLRTERIEQQLLEQRRETDRRFQEVEDQIAALTRTVDTLRDDVGELKGDSLERRYREKAGAYFGRLLRRARVVADDELNEMLEDAVERGALTEDEYDEVTWADAVVRGRRRGDRTQVVAVAEVSWGVGIRDVERARRRADLLAKLGFTTLPVVGGKAVTREAAELAREQGVWQLFDGRLVAPDTVAASE
ncbi:MAG: hypothetical protein OXQ31_23410 [Spirochaetaceae bacterium]|nr:hypothetical protein [Spirochaetaceae bacterium]